VKTDHETDRSCIKLNSDIQMPSQAGDRPGPNETGAPNGEEAGERYGWHTRTR
jgi:hypothetical protein